MHAQDPDVFSVDVGNLRGFSLTEMTYSLGMMLGPLITGLLFEGIGFFYMSVIMGESLVFPLSMARKQSLPPTTPISNSLMRTL